MGLDPRVEITGELIYAFHRAFSMMTGSTRPDL